MKKLLMALTVFGLAINSFAEYAEQFKSWTPEQKAAVKQWTLEFHGFNPGKSVVAARDAFNLRPIASTTYVTNTIVKDDQIAVLLANKLKTIAQAYGINQAMTPAQMNQKFVDAYTAISGNTAGSIAQRDQIVMDRGDFWLGYFTLKTMTPDDSATYLQIVPVYTYADSIRMTMGLPADVTCDDLEEAYRYQP